MFALVSKNLAYLIAKHSSSLSAHLFSTLRNGQNVICPRVYDLLLHKYQFSPGVASRAASHFTQFRSPMKIDLILSFFEECGFSSTQLEKIVKYDPRILWHSVDDIKFKIKILQDLGLSSEDIAKIVSSNQKVLYLSAKRFIVPTLSLLKGLLGSNYDVARLIKKSGWCLTSDLKRSLLPNVELLKSCGISMERILYLLYLQPRRLLMKPDVIRKSVDMAKEMGFRESSKMFIHAVEVIAPIRKGMWEVKLQAFRDLGFSDSDTLTMFKKVPKVFSVSMKKIENIKELLLATGKFNISSIVGNPACLGCSIEKRLKPRLRILGILESRNLIEEWPALGTLYTLSDDKFLERYIRPYSDEVGEAFDTKSYVKGKVNCAAS